MGWMFLGHLLDWWLKPEYFSLKDFTHSILDPIGASGFLFISGVSMAISYRDRIYRVEILNELSYSRVKQSYYFRVLFLLIIALCYNFAIALSIGNLSWIWTWFVLMTAAFSLLITWPLFKLSKKTRIIIGFSIWIINQFIYNFLSPHQGLTTLQGVLYHILYNDLGQDTFLNFFPFFLFGTIIGDVLSEINFNKKPQNRKNELKKKLFLPMSIFGLLLIFFGLIFDFPSFLIRSSFSWLIYTLGINLILLLILITLEEFNVFKTKRSYRLLFYFSYYSFTVYLGHNLMYYIFLNSLNPLSIWIAVVFSFILIGLILRQIYKTWGWKASLKVILGKISFYLAGRVEEKNKR